MQFSGKPGDTSQKRGVPAMFIAAVDIWNDMDGKIEWEGIEIEAARYGVDDIDALITCLTTIRQHKRKTSGGGV